MLTDTCNIAKPLTATGTSTASNATEGHKLWYCYICKNTSNRGIPQAAQRHASDAENARGAVQLEHAGALGNRLPGFRVCRTGTGRLARRETAGMRRAYCLQAHEAERQADSDTWPAHRAVYERREQCAPEDPRDAWARREPSMHGAHDRALECKKTQRGAHSSTKQYMRGTFMRRSVVWPQPRLPGF